MKETNKERGNYEKIGKNLMKYYNDVIVYSN